METQVEQNISLSNSQDEQMRAMLIEKNIECNRLKDEIKMLKRSVAEEQEGKYRAYIKLADLQRLHPST